MYEDPNLCEACLSKDRKLVIINRIRPLIEYLDIKELAKSQGCICWECYMTIIRFNNFRCIAREVQDILAKRTEHKKSFSNLGITKINHYDYQFEYIEAKTQENETTEPVLVKQELDNDSDIEGTVFADFIDCKIETKLPTKRLSKDVSDVSENIEKRLPSKRLSTKRSKDTPDLLDKFETVVLTEERFESKSLSTKRSKDTPNSPDKFETVVLTEGRLESKSLLSKRSKDTPDSPDKFETVVLTEERLESKSLPSKKLSAKRLKDMPELPDLSHKFEMVTLTDEEVAKSREEKRNHHNYKKLPYKCDYCVLGFTNRENYDSHMAIKHDEEKGKPCDVCSVRFTNLIILQNHRALHYQYFKCKFCEYKGSTHMAIVKHVTDKHENDSTDNIHCKLCTQCFRNPEEISEHMRTEHTLYCNECGANFKTKGNLRLHIKRLHTVKREFICSECKKTFLTKSRLETHMTRHSTTLAKRLAYCTVCRVQYKDLAIYRSHLRNSVNHVQEKFPCPDCDKKFASKAYWKKHYNFYHLKKSQHKCEECDKIFMSYFLLKGHRQKYHGLTRPRNHICNVCQKSFYNITNLRAHLQIHSSHRAYMCAKCGDTFKQRPALYTHQRLVHSDTK